MAMDELVCLVYTLVGLATGAACAVLDRPRARADALAEDRESPSLIVVYFIVGMAWPLSLPLLLLSLIKGRARGGGRGSSGITGGPAGDGVNQTALS
jgi:hypothetical protein